MQTQNTTTIPTPLFSTSTAYKHLLGLQRNDQENTVYALFSYMPGDVLQVWRGRDIGLGVEKYQFEDSFCCTDGYNLLSKQKDYEDYLPQDVTENARLKDAFKKDVALFNVAYNPETTTLLKRLKGNIKFGKPCTIIKNAYDEYNPLVITKGSKDLVVVDGCAPIFKSCASFASNSSYIYIYELRLIKSIDYIADSYFIRPCLQISLFKNSGDADKYFNNSNMERQKFQEHHLYPELVKLADRAIKRFEKYIEHQK
jgi:hypothetical protein